MGTEYVNCLLVLESLSKVLLDVHCISLHLAGLENPLVPSYLRVPLPTGQVKHKDDFQCKLTFFSQMQIIV